MPRFRKKVTQKVLAITRLCVTTHVLARSGGEDHVTIWKLYFTDCENTYKRLFFSSFKGLLVGNFQKSVTQKYWPPTKNAWVTVQYRLRVRSLGFFFQETRGTLVLASPPAIRRSRPTPTPTTEARGKNVAQVMIKRNRLVKRRYQKWNKTQAWYEAFF